MLICVHIECHQVNTILLVLNIQISSNIKYIGNLSENHWKTLLHDKKPKVCINICTDNKILKNFQITIQCELTVILIFNMKNS